MTEHAHTDDNGLTLTGLDGGNPLAFLAAIGTLRSLTLAWPDKDVRMSWTQRAGAWRPVVKATESLTPSAVAAAVAERLRCGFKPSPALEAERERSEKEFSGIRTQIGKLVKDIKERRLSRQDRADALENEVAPLEKEAAAARTAWLKVLPDVVPFPEMRLGKHLDCTRGEFRDTGQGMLDGATLSSREPLDMLASFGSDACFEPKTTKIKATPFCFITGSGWQYFLDTARQLVSNVTEERVLTALFEQWNHSDETLSMRWDPVEDRRYALMWADPTDAKNKPMTNWAANLIAYRGLQMFPSVPTQSGLRTVAFPKGKAFTWPIWRCYISADMARSILGLQALAADRCDTKVASAYGLATAFCAERLVVGDPPLNKINFTPARALF